MNIIGNNGAGRVQFHGRLETIPSLRGTLAKPDVITVVCIGNSAVQGWLRLTKRTIYFHRQKLGARRKRFRLSARCVSSFLLPLFIYLLYIFTRNLVV